MRMIFYRAEKNYEKALSGCLVEGAAAAGIELVEKSTADYAGPEADGGVIMGVVKREILWEHQAKGHPIIVIDKGYCRDRSNLNGQSVPAWWRMCWQDVHPTAYFMKRSRPGDRWAKMGMMLSPRQRAPHDGKIIILGSSGKFHETMRMEDPTTWARLVRDSIHRHCRNPLVLRPKPSWKYAVPVDGMVFDWGTKSDVRVTLAGAWCAVTYGSIACVDAICAGVPCIVLGNGVAAPVSGNFLTDVTNPVWKIMAEREQWAANLAYTNFTPSEIGNGTAFSILKEQMSHAF